MNMQEKFWAGKFGDDYTYRHSDKQLIKSNINLFQKALAKTKNIRSVIEFGANRGLNLIALNAISEHELEITAIEINQAACKELQNINNVKVWKGSALDCIGLPAHDLVLTKGFLIHIAPAELLSMYSKIYKASNRYILIAEYFNPTPVMVTYHGQSDRLWKRDFCDDFLASFPDLKLLDYGFVYSGDPVAPQDDLNWFLLEKT